MDLNGRIATLLSAQGVTVVRVDGDLLDHPEFHADYDAFVAPHYEADVHNGQGGCFWGRAAASTTAALDDKLGGVFWKRFRTIEGVPPERFEWSNPNVTDYYGFRLTSATTPGILVEHGVGWGANKAWLRDKIGDITNAWVAALLEFGGVSAPTPGGDIVTDDEFKEKFARLIGPNLEAEIQQRKQEAVAEALKQASAKLAS